MLTKGFFEQRPKGVRDRAIQKPGRAGGPREEGRPSTRLGWGSPSMTEDPEGQFPQLGFSGWQGWDAPSPLLETFPGVHRSFLAVCLNLSATLRARQGLFLPQPYPSLYLRFAEPKTSAETWLELAIFQDVDFKKGSPICCRLNVCGLRPLGICMLKSLPRLQWYLEVGPLGWD